MRCSGGVSGIEAMHRNLACIAGGAIVDEAAYAR